MKIFNDLKLGLILVTTILFTVSCEENKEEEILSHKVMVNSGIDFVSVGHPERTIVLDINSQENCKIVEDADWFTIDKTGLSKGKTTLTLTLAENKGKPRFDNIEFLSEGFSQLLTIQQNAANTGFADVTHNFYATFGTMPSLYAGLQLLTEEKPSYFFFERTNTFDVTQFPAHAKYISTGHNDMQEQMRDEMKKHILDINRAEPNAIFGLTVDDIRAKISYDWFAAQGIDSSRVKVTLVTDGTGSYAEFYNEFGSVEKGEGNWGKYKDEVDALKWDMYSSTEKKISPFAISEFGSTYWPSYMSTFSGYRYVLQDATLLETNSPFVQKKLEEEMNLVSLPPVEILNKLSQEKQDKFRKMAKFDIKVIRDMFDESPKKNLIIISTAPSSTIMEYILQTIDLYSGEYDIFMSVHPGDADSDQLQELEKEGKVKLFTKGLPFEVLLWSFMDDIHAIGGAQSTVFLTVPVEKVKFMYAEDAESMYKPLDKLMKDQAGINWMIK